MKRYFLYFLLVLLFVGLAMLAFGFYNARKIRSWATAAAQVMSENNSYSQEKNIKAGFDASGGKNTEEMKGEFESFSADLDSIAQETKAAGDKIGKLGGPADVKTVQNELLDYYQQSEDQTKNLASVMKFMSQLLEVAVIFDRIKADATLDQIKGMIVEAKTKSGEVNAQTLPEDIAGDGKILKDATDKFLTDMEQAAAGTTENSSELNASYADFSAKEDTFFSGAKKYIDTFQNLEPAKRKIDNDLIILGKVQFSLK